MRQNVLTQGRHCEHHTRVASVQNSHWHIVAAEVCIYKTDTPPQLDDDDDAITYYTLERQVGSYQANTDQLMHSRDDERKFKYLQIE